MLNYYGKTTSLAMTKTVSERRAREGGLNYISDTPVSLFLIFIRLIYFFQHKKVLILKVYSF